jgi:CheY-like chemotaxis protein
MVACSILIVDDEPEIRELLRILLSGEGHTVACASDGKDGARAMAAQPFDLVLTDLLMPERDGLEFISDIVRDYPAVHIIAMSGGGHIARDSYLKIAKGFGAHVLLQKPFDLATVLEAVEVVQKIPI